MSLRKMIVVECWFVGSYASRSFAFPILFSRRKTNRSEVCEIIRKQLVVEFGSDLASDCYRCEAWLPATPQHSYRLSFTNKQLAKLVA
jgi:hypothetical protein